MRNLSLGLACSFLIVGTIACNVYSTPAPTVSTMATAIAGTLTAQAQLAAAVNATLTAIAPPQPAVTPTPPPVIASPVLPPQVVVPPVAPPPSVYYNLVMRYSKNCLSVQGNQAIEATCGQGTQLWNLSTDTTGGYFQLQLQNTGKCVSASSTLHTDPFVLRNCSGDDSVLWQKNPSGGYFQLVNKTQLAEGPSKMCVDARQWDQPIMQWFCKPYGTDDQLDNQLLCQTTTNTDSCEPPPGVYVTNIQQTPPPYADEGTPNTFHVYINVTFSNTTGSAQPYRWFVQTYGQNAGQTSEQVLPIPPGATTITVGPWNIGRTCTNFTAKAVWRRASNGLLFSFKDPSGREYSLSFQIHTGC